MLWKKPNKKSKTIWEIRKELPIGHWQHSKTYLLVHTCHEWNRLPSEMGLCEPEFDLPLMTAYVLVKTTMQAYDDFIRTKEIEEKSGKVTANPNMRKRAR